MTKLMHWIGVTALLAANSPIAAQNTDMAGGDPADEVIYLDVTDEYRDPWSALRNTEADAEREPGLIQICLLYTSPSPRDATLSRMPSSA